MKEIKMQPVPEVGKEYYFFDDGKISPSRCYKAKVVRVIPYNEAKNIILDTINEYIDDLIPTSLIDIHKIEVDNNRQCEHFVVLGRGDTTPGTPYLYTEKSDFFVECEIPGYDENNIWFARTVWGGWFSMDIQSSWQSGTLDIDFSIYNNAKKEFEHFDYDKALKEKGEFINI